MSREVRRVPAGFDWPIGKTWPGFLTPDWLDEGACPDCENGYSPRAEALFAEWYGNAPFDPASTGSTLLTVETPGVRAFAERNIVSSPSFYGDGESAIVREAQRLANLWNGMWSHHLSQEDVDALVDGDRLWDFTRTWSAEARWQPKVPAYRPTAPEVNEWSLRGFGHDSLNAGIVIQARCEREGVAHRCATCGGHASIERFVGQRALAEAWESTPPPTGDWWQVWETVSEGSPYTPAFETPEELARYYVAKHGGTVEQTLEWLTGPGWAPSMVIASGVMRTSDEIVTKGTP